MRNVIICFVIGIAMATNFVVGFLNGLDMGRKEVRAETANGLRDN